MKDRMQNIVTVITICLLSTGFTSAEWQWIETDFPENVNSFAGTSIGHRLFITSYNTSEYTGQIYTSNDFGARWSMIADFQQRTNLTSIVATSNNRLYVMSYNCQTQEYELMISDDLGQTWNPGSLLPVVSESHEYRYIQIHNGMNDQLFISAPLLDYTDTYLSVSDDFAQSWLPCGSMPEGRQLSSLKVISSDHLLAGDVTGNILESFDSGDSWTCCEQVYPSAIVALECIPQERCLAGISFIPFLFSREWNSDEWDLASSEFAAKDFCVSSQSAVYVATGNVFQSVDNGITWEEMIVNSENAIVSRLFQADDGYLYGTGGKAVIRSAEPVIPPTFTPTAGTGTPTYTPHPPSFTPTPWPSHTPTFTPTPQRPTQPPMPTPSCPGIGVYLEHSDGNPIVGSPFYLTARVCNTLNFPLDDICLFVLLQIGESIWYAPGWTGDVDSFGLDWQPGWTELPVIPEFEWPDSAGSYSGAVFWSALVNPTMTSIIGEYDSWEFSW